VGVDAREAARRSACKGHLKQLGLALLIYHDEYGTFPPAYVADANGKPMHSWRVLILPFIDQSDLYEMYDFSQPWNGPDNSKLGLDEYPVRLFNCPTAAPNGCQTTNYVAVVGPQTAWPGRKPTKVLKLFNNYTKTILLVEINDSNIHWMEPRDLTFKDAVAGINNGSGLRISSGHREKRHYLTAGGAVETFPAGLSVEQLKAMLRPD
jgi:hypothetical protein